MVNFRTEIISIQDTIINWRRDFHKNPELSFKEFRTGELIAKELRSMGLEPKTKVGKTGVTADLEFGSGPMIALRADMDALPIQETSNTIFFKTMMALCMLVVMMDIWQYFWVPQKC